jgi:hypothetical protein
MTITATIFLLSDAERIFIDRKINESLNISTSHYAFEGSLTGMLQDNSAGAVNWGHG